jgi:hypothetical protein
MPPETPPDDGLPASWSASARSTYSEIEAARADLDAVGLAALYEACALLAFADEMQARVNEDGLVVTGSKDQPAAHPLISEILRARGQALAALRVLDAGRVRSGASQAGSALVSKRWHGPRAA